jgi:LacI family transcriptional regulator
MSAKIKDVAYKAGVSTATVSHVINNTRNVSDKVKVRVYQAMEELQYMPNMIARSLRSRKSKIIGLIVPIKANDNANIFFLSVANGIESVLKKEGYHLLLSNSQEDPAEEMDRIKIFNNQFIDGLIIAPTIGLENQRKDAIFGEYPVVFIDRKPRDIPGDSVLVDGTKGTYEGVVGLLERGHRRIGLIAGLMGISTTEQRLHGYLKALSEYGVEPDESMMKSGDMSWQTGYQLAEEILKQGEVTALFVANNAMSLGALKYLQENNISIPDQVALIGFDDYEWTEVATPSLSVIRQPSYELGVKAAEILLNRLDLPMIGNQDILLDSELVLRNSV